MKTLTMQLITTAAALLFLESRGLAQDNNLIDFHADLSGAQEVVPADAPTTPSPGIETAASGRLQMTVTQDLSSLQFQLFVQNGVKVTQAHLHCGRPGENGPVVVTLSPPNQQGADVNGLLAEGARTNTNIETSAADCEELIGRPVRNIASLTAAAVLGFIYANVHTIANPAGEIRGQVILGEGEQPTTPASLAK